MDLRERPSGAFVRHPWETARARFFARLVAHHAERPTPPEVLDVGSGDTWFAAQLAARCPQLRIVCWDTSYSPELLAALSPTAPAQVTLSVARPQRRFDWLLLLDVLEHVDDDGAFLGELVRENLADGGRLLASVPAWPSLFGRRDLRMGHRRRYSRHGFQALLAAAGLRVTRGGGLFYSLLVPRWLSHRIERARGEHGPRGAFDLEWRHGPASARWVHRALCLDSALGLAASRLRLDAPGLSCWALCEKSR